MHRAVGRLEAVLDDLMTGYCKESLARIYAEEAESRNRGFSGWMLRWESIWESQTLDLLDLLAHRCRRSLIEVRDWFADLVDSITDLITALKKRGLPTSEAVELKFTLEIASAPELELLGRWVERLGVALERRMLS